MRGGSHLVAGSRCPWRLLVPSGPSKIPLRARGHIVSNFERCAERLAMTPFHFGLTCPGLERFGSFGKDLVPVCLDHRPFLCLLFS